MFRRLCRSLLLVTWLAWEIVCGQTILWSSDSLAVNKTSDGQLMDAGFRFELGVFTGTFVPTTANKTSWAANWDPMQRTAYDPVEKQYANSFTPENNNGPFVAGKAVYVWGFRGNAAIGEWILFRAENWTFPDANPPVPHPPIVWLAKNATPVLGSINFGGGPFLMRSAAVTNAAPPTTTWEQWQADYLSNEPLDGPNDDPDHDGVINLMEYVFGLPPKQAGVPPQTPVSFVQVGGQNYLQITIPRRIDHKSATLSVEVSSDLKNWSSGSAVVEMSNTPTTWVVRDATPSGPGLPKRFMRLGATLP